MKKVGAVSISTLCVVASLIARGYVLNAKSERESIKQEIKESQARVKEASADQLENDYATVTIDFGDTIVDYLGMDYAEFEAYLSEGESEDYSGSVADQYLFVWKLDIDYWKDFIEDKLIEREAEIAEFSENYYCEHTSDYATATVYVDENLGLDDIETFSKKLIAQMAMCQMINGTVELNKFYDPEIFEVWSAEVYVYNLDSGEEIYYISDEVEADEEEISETEEE